MSGSAWLLMRFRRHISELIRLSYPIVISRAGILVMVMADVMMVGRYGSLDLAYLMIGTTLIIPLLITAVGLIMGTLVISANSYGEEKFKECGAAWRRSMPFSLLLGGMGIVIAMFGEEILLLTGQSADMSLNGSHIMVVAAIGIPGHMMFVATSFFLEGIKRPLPGMVAMIIANIVNIVLNWCLIYGIGDIPEMGAMGAIWATSIARWTLGIVLVAYVWFMRDRDTFGIREKPTGGWAAWKKQRQIGYATGISVGVESTAFATMNLIAGQLGAFDLAAFSIALNLLAVPFMMALGLGAATAVRVGIAYGRKDYHDLPLAGWSGLILTSFVLGLVALAYFLIPDQFAALYTNDTELLPVASMLLVIVAMALVMDGGQAVMANALRGRQDVWFPSAIQTFSYIGVMIPGSWIFVYYLDIGVAGLMYGILVASVVSVVLLSLRFYFLHLGDHERFNSQN